MEVHKPTIEFHGPAATHDQGCAVCYTNHAVYSFGEGVFLPCWHCQENGWRLSKPWGWRWLLRLLHADGPKPIR
jgi:hypothetical protein